MKNKFTQEIIVSTAFIVLVVLYMNPFDWHMTTTALTFTMAMVVVVFGVFIGLVFDERPRDEREALHVRVASRAGYVAGLIAVVGVIAVQSIQGDVDTWALVVLGVMVLGKSWGAWWAKKRG